VVRRPAREVTAAGRAKLEPGDAAGVEGAGNPGAVRSTRRIRSRHGRPVYDGGMSSDEGMRVVGTIRSIELHTLAAKFQNVATRQVAKIQLDIERAVDETGAEIDIANLAGLQFQGPAELVPRFSTGDRVQIVTSVDSSLQIASIRPAPLS
jgi:hypothetical protein